MTNRWTEWAIGGCFLALSAIAAWTVFGDELGQLLSGTASTPAALAQGTR